MALLVVPQARAVVPELGRSSISKCELSTKFRSDLVLKQNCPALRECHSDGRGVAEPLQVSGGGVSGVSFLRCRVISHSLPWCNFSK